MTDAANDDGKLPAIAAKLLLDKYGMDEVVIIARDYDEGTTFHTASWGTTDEAAGNAALTAISIVKMIEAYGANPDIDHNRAAEVLGAAIKGKISEIVGTIRAHAMQQTCAVLIRQAIQHGDLDLLRSVLRVPAETHLTQFVESLGFVAHDTKE